VSGRASTLPRVPGRASRVFRRDAGVGMDYPTPAPNQGDSSLGPGHRLAMSSAHPLKKPPRSVVALSRQLLAQPPPILWRGHRPRDRRRAPVLAVVRRSPGRGTLGPRLALRRRCGPLRWYRRLPVGRLDPTTDDIPRGAWDSAHLAHSRPTTNNPSGFCQFRQSPGYVVAIQSGRLRQFGGRAALRLP
jgi:hypothetical protein